MRGTTDWSVYRTISGQLVADMTPKVACELWVELSRTSSPVLRAFREELGKLCLPSLDTNGPAEEPASKKRGGKTP